VRRRLGARAALRAFFCDTFVGRVFALPSGCAAAVWDISAAELSAAGRDAGTCGGIGASALGGESGTGTVRPSGSRAIVGVSPGPRRRITRVFGAWRDAGGAAEAAVSPLVVLATEREAPAASLASREAAGATPRARMGVNSPKSLKLACRGAERP
jgi:hypothetical protein